MSEKVRFLNVSTKDGHLMSTPKYPQDQALIGETIHAIEKANPRIAWLQFSFVKVDLLRALTEMKLGMQYFKKMAETPTTKFDIDTKQSYEVPKKELDTDWYRRSDGRMEHIDKIEHAGQVLMAIQGMWVGDPAEIYDLPFSHCIDELDSLGEFVYKDPRMLVELVERRMVQDITPYIRRYSGVRMEPPSFIVTPDMLPSYIHIPVPPQSSALSSIEWGVTVGAVQKGGGWGEQEAEAPQSDSLIMEATRIPQLEEPLPEEVVARLQHVYSSVQRTFEILYVDGTTKILISSKTPEDLRQYIMHLESIYGPMDFMPAERIPAALYQLPIITGIAMEEVPHRNKAGEALQRPGPDDVPVGTSAEQPVAEKRGDGQ